MKNKIYYTFYDLFSNRSALEADRLLSGSQYWDRKTLESYQIEKITHLLEHAKKNVPFYRDRISSLPKTGCSYSEMLACLGNISILSKQDIQNHHDELVDSNANEKEMVAQVTGGTTGQPTRFFHDRKKLDYTRVALQRNFDWAGYTLRRKCLRLASGSLEAASYNRLKGRIKNILHNRHFYEAAVLDGDKWVEEVRSLIKKEKIEVLWGYPSILFMLARKIENGSELGIKTIVLSSETLQENQRYAIEKAFGCQVFNEYASREFMIAGECTAHDGLHINEDILLVEILDDAGNPCAPGETGRIVITDLMNFHFPFIRYEIGDRGCFAEDKTCSCGRSLRRLQEVSGRTSDAIELGGKHISSVFFFGYFKMHEDVDAFQVFIYKDRLKLDVMLNKQGSSETLEKIQNAMLAKLGASVSIDVNSVTVFHREKNGKIIPVKIMEQLNHD